MIPGIQISSFKPLMNGEKGLEAVLIRMRDMGCACTQLQWIDRSIPAEIVSRLLKKYGISSYGTQDKLAAVLEDTDYYLDLCTLSGGTDFCFSGLSCGAGSFRTLTDTLDQVFAAARRRGLKASYHPVRSDPPEWREMLPDLRPDLRLTVDVCQLHDAGEDPAAFIRRWAGRVDAVHFKDRDAKGNLCPVGSGTIDFESAFRACRDAGAKAIFVEQESWTDAFEELEQGFQYVRKLCEAG